MKKLLTLAVLGILSLGFAGCDTLKTISGGLKVVEGVRITQQQMDAIKATYDTTVLAPYNFYRYEDAGFTTQRRYCTKSHPFQVSDPCASYSVLAKLQPILKASNDALVNLQAKVSGCEKDGDNSACSGISGAKATFDAAVSVAKSALTSFGVIK